MPRGTESRKSQSSSSNAPDPDLLKHIAALGLRTVEEYRGWCSRHGFSLRTQKHWRLRMKERALATQAIADARVARKKAEIRSPETVIQHIFAGEISADAVTQPHLAAICRAHESVKQCRQTHEALRGLLLHVARNADLLSADPVISAYGCGEGNSFVAALRALAQHTRCWIRPLVDWRAQSHNSYRQFVSLAHHLIAQWPMPACLNGVWFKGSSAEGRRQQAWFVHVGRGRNLRTADLPLPYTKRMAHHFMQAPQDMHVEAALRYGQIRALGGSERLVRAVVATPLGTEFEHDEFWTSVLGWFIAHPGVPMARVGPIIDFIRYQKYAPTEARLATGEVEDRSPPRPHLAMAGRTPASLWRQVEAWHGHLANVRVPMAEWHESGFPAFEFREGSTKNGNLRVWTLTELLSTKALVHEGCQMKHCVAAYAHACQRGRCSIWTLEVQSPEGRRKVLTVEVNNAARLICQARAKGNALPGDKHRVLLHRWAQEAGLHVMSGI